MILDIIVTDYPIVFILFMRHEEERYQTIIQSQHY